MTHAPAEPTPTEPTPVTLAECAQCGTRTREMSDSEYGLLCMVCAHRQATFDDQRDHFSHLSGSTFGFSAEECAGDYDD